LKLHTYVALVEVHLARTGEHDGYRTVTVTAPTIEKAIRTVCTVVNDTVDPIFDGPPYTVEILIIGREDVAWEHPLAPRSDE
jgi:hypothetical protein